MSVGSLVVVGNGDGSYVGRLIGRDVDVVGFCVGGLVGRREGSWDGIDKRGDVGQNTSIGSFTWLCRLRCNNY